ncbi:MAG: Oligopeptide transporter ATP-binding protein [Firmicutes bacterium]|nr:Oligopeptide transporter ATP-binding protein [Bacillota bacterium]
MLEVTNLQKYFPVSSGPFSRAKTYIKAVQDATFTVQQGEALGIVGESGSGKSTLAKAMLRLIEPTGGSVKLEGRELTTLPERELNKLRARMAMVFQDPYSSLNPRMTVFETVAEPLTIHGVASGKAAQRRVKELIELVGLREEHLFRFPHEFSGGQRQRIGIARALALNPKLLVLDEPTSALDVSVQAQVLALLKQLQKELGLTYVFISHDLGVIRYICDHVAVMYLGRIVETGSVEQIFQSPTHAYTRSLLDAIPQPDPDLAWVPSPLDERGNR